MPTWRLGGERRVGHCGWCCQWRPNRRDWASDSLVSLLVTGLHCNVVAGQRRTCWHELFLCCSLTPTTVSLAQLTAPTRQSPADISQVRSGQVRSGQVRQDLPSNRSWGKLTDSDFPESNERTHRDPDWSEGEGERREKSDQYYLIIFIRKIFPVRGKLHSIKFLIVPL